MQLEALFIERRVFVFANHSCQTSYDFSGGQPQGHQHYFLCSLQFLPLLTHPSQQSPFPVLLESQQLPSEQAVVQMFGGSVVCWYASGLGEQISTLDKHWP